MAKRDEQDKVKFDKNILKKRRQSKVTMESLYKFVDFIFDDKVRGKETARVCDKDGS